MITDSQEPCSQRLSASINARRAEFGGRGGVSPPPPAGPHEPGCNAEREELSGRLPDDG